MRPACFIVALAAWLASSTAILHGDTPLNLTASGERTPILTPEQLEADWIQENAVRGVPVAPSVEITPEEDAGGGGDGIVDGLWGFHTALEDDPWWQIDLKRSMSLDQIQVYNRFEPRRPSGQRTHLGRVAPAPASGRPARRYRPPIEK